MAVACTVVAAADWSTDARHRWLASAVRQRDGHYEVRAPEPVGEPRTLLRRLSAEAGPGGTALAGFDFPIGLPAAYARAARIDCFRSALPRFGAGAWDAFYDVSDAPCLRQPFGPRRNPRGGLTRDGLARALGLDARRDLLRACDAATRTRAGAEALFFTRFAKQVGRAAIHGWRHVLGPSADAIRIWPFDGDLAGLLRDPGVVVAEIYPAEACAHLGLAVGSRSGRSKNDPQARRAAVSRLFAVTEEAGIRWSSVARRCGRDGFVSGDAFDAVVGVVSMLLVVLGHRREGAPRQSAVRRVEGWILGQESTA